jgi:hypothetical protein
MRGIAQQGVVAGCCRGAGRGVDAQQHHLGQPLQGFALDPGQGPQGMKGLRIGFLMRFQRMPPDQNRGQPLLEQAEQVQGRWHAVRVGNAAFLIELVHAADDPPLDLIAGAAVPGVTQGLALSLRQKHQEICLTFHAQEVHGQPGLQLVRGVAVDVEAGHQQVVDALQQGVADHPGRFGGIPDQTVLHARVGPAAV